jgi:response regulator of citrate/malate metabolism
MQNGFLTGKMQVRIVLVEDSPAIQTLIQSELQQISGVMLIGIATGPADGLRMIAQNPVDLVIADLFLDDGNAIEILEQFQHRQTKPQMVVITNAPSLELRERCLSLGASGFFDKAEGFDWLPGEIEAVRCQMASLDTPGD